MKLQKLKNLYHFLIAVLANIYYGFPSRKLKVIGITGTDGKTTTSHLVYHILKTSGKKVSLVSSVVSPGLHVTTPDSFQLQKLLRQAVNRGEEYFVLETTSHALDQYRVWGINYQIGLITNVTHEHLDYHLTYEDYVKTKVKLLLNSKLGFINKDDRSFSLLKKITQNSNVKIQSYSLNPKIIKTIPSLTKFNEYNYSAAYVICRALGISDEEILKGMKSFQLPPGRLETVYDKDFKVIIDFAHTPNALEKLFQSVKGEIIHVFGAAGLRDYLKRPLMGKISSQYAKTIILTEEDYRTEDPQKICQQIAKGIKGKKYYIILNRQQAIEKALSLVKKGEIVLITGKGHEQSLCRGNKEYPWSDQLAVKKILNDKL
jgi:UDP-N-acetylmuramoyl-L-alanyl-D-glutamate--2,6-diaminopimelate ligase